MITIDELFRPEPGAGELMVRVKAAGGIGDALVREGKIQHTLPLVLGFELSGIVEAVGAEADWAATLATKYMSNLRVGTYPKRKHDRKRVFDRSNLPGYEPTPTLLKKGAVRGGAPVVSAAKEVGSMAETVKASPQIVNAYLRIFVNRRAYTMQSMRPRPENGRHYYFRPTKKNTGTRMELTKETIRRHLEGQITIGLYAINPATQRCKWVAIDADYKNALKDLLKLQCHLWQDNVESALEMSKRGGHLWILLATPLLASECRVYIHDLARRLGLPVKGSGLGDGIEVFPRHNAIGEGEFGNALRGPLGVHRGAGRRFWFYGADYTLEAQMAYLDRLRKLTEEELRRFIASKEIPQEFASMESHPARASRKPVGSGFRIMDHLGKVRRVGRNYVGRCPSCAQAGHDRSGDNLAIRIEDPQFYKCWAGCTREMIRAAVGHPIRVSADRLGGVVR